MIFRRYTVVHDAAVLAGGSIFLQGLLFLYRLMLSRFAGAEGMGLYHLVFSVYVTLHAFCLSGCCTVCTRSAAGRTDTEGTSVILAHALRTFFLFFLPSAGLLLVFRTEVSSLLLGDDRCSAVFPLLLLCLLLTGIENCIKSYFIGKRQMHRAVFSELGEQCVRILAVFLLLRFHPEESQITIRIFAGMTCSEIASACYLTFWYRRQRNRTASERFPVRGAFFPFLKAAFPISLSALLSGLLSSASAVLLPRLLVLSGLTAKQALCELGTVTGIALPLFMLPSAWIAPLCSASLPAISAAYRAGYENRTRQLIHRLFFSVSGIGFCSAAVLALAAPSLATLLFSLSFPHFFSFALACTAATTYLMMAANSVLNALGWEKTGVLLTLLCETIQLLLTCVLVVSSKIRMVGYFFAMTISAILFYFGTKYCLMRNNIYKTTARYGVRHGALFSLLLYVAALPVERVLQKMPFPFLRIGILFAFCIVFFLLLLRCFSIDWRAYLLSRRSEGT